MGGLLDSLFPKHKNQSNDELIVECKTLLKRHQKKIDLIAKKADISKKNSKIAVKRGERARAQAYLTKYKLYMQQITKTQHVDMRLEDLKFSLEMGDDFEQAAGLIEDMGTALENIVQKIGPMKIDRLMAQIEMNQEKLGSAMEILGADPEIDYDFDLNAEYEALEEEVLAEEGGTLPETPKEDFHYIPESELEGEVSEDMETIETMSKEDLKKAIEEEKEALKKGI